MANGLEKGRGNDAYALAEALKKIGSPAAIQALTHALEHPDLGARMQAVRALLTFDATRPRALAVTRELLETWAPHAHEVPEETRFHPAEDASNGSEPDPSPIALQLGTLCGFLTGTNGVPSELAPVLARVVTSPYRHVAQNSALALARIGPPAKVAVPALTQALQHDSALVRNHAAFALAKIDSKSSAAVQVLIEGLKHPNREVRADAAGHLAELGEAVRPALPELKKLLHDPLDFPRFRAAHAVWNLDHRPDEVVPALISVLEYSIRITGAMEVLGEIGPPAKAAIPILQRAAKTRWSAKANEALAKIDPEAFGRKGNL